MHQPSTSRPRRPQRWGRIRAVRPQRPSPIADRQTALCRVLPFWPHELEDESTQSRRRVAERLHRALRAERRRGVAGHWTYDLARHVELLRLYRAELAALADMGRQKPERHPDAPGGAKRGEGV